MDEFKKLAKRWRRRRERLRERCNGLSGIDTPQNQRWANIYYGQFQEVEKCAGELITFIRSQKKIVEAQKLSHNTTKVKTCPEFIAGHSCACWLQ